MSNFYDKLARVRDEMRNSKEFPYVKAVLDQLLITTFNNEKQPDTLPKIFFLENIHYTTNLETIFFKLGLSIECHRIYMDWINKIANFQITIVKTGM